MNLIGDGRNPPWNITHPHCNLLVPDTYSIIDRIKVHDAADMSFNMYIACPTTHPWRDKVTYNFNSFYAVVVNYWPS